MPHICKIQDEDFGPGVDPKTKPNSFDETVYFYNEFFVSYDIYDNKRHFKRAEESINTSSIEIDVDEYLITDSTSEDLTLKTFGLGPCVGLILYHPNTKKTLLAHCYFLNPTLEKNLEKMLREFSLDKTYLEETQAILWGGIKENQASIDTANILIKGLKNNNIQLNTLCLFPQLIGYRFTPSSSFKRDTGVLTIDYLIFNALELNKSEKRLAALKAPAPIPQSIDLPSKQTIQISDSIEHIFFGLKNHPDTTLEESHMQPSHT